MLFISPAAASDAAHGSSHGSGAFPPFDSTYFPSQLFWLAITFGLLYWLMSRVALPRIASILAAREHSIQGDIAAARKARDESHAAKEAHDKKIADARAKAQATAHAAYDQLEAETRAAREVLEKELHDKISAAETQIAATKAKAMANVNQIATEAASAIFEQVAGVKADSQRLAAAVAQAMKG